MRESFYLIVLLSLIQHTCFSQNLGGYHTFGTNRYVIDQHNEYFFFRNSQGEKLTKLGYWDYAEEFKGKPFTLVKKQGESFYMDTTGKTFCLATQLAQLDEKTEALDLSKLSLSSFPEEVLAYPNLKVLILDNQDIDIHSEINKLKNLYYLSAKNCRLYNLPESIAKLQSLKHLYLDRNFFTQIPNLLFDLRQLVTLSLANNGLNSLSKHLTYFQHLKHLNVSGNSLGKFPENLGRLKYLEVLSISLNDQEIPKTVWELTSLRYLCIRGGGYQTVSPQIGHLKQLEELELCDAPIQKLPISIEELQQLRILSMGMTSLKSLPETFGKLKNLEELFMEPHYITRFPESFGNLSKLKYLWISGELIEKYPPFFKKLTNLETLMLTDLSLKEFPPITSFKKLKEFTLYNRNITSIPDDIGSLKQLEIFEMPWTQVSVLPKNFEQLDKLTELNLTESAIHTLPRGLNSLEKVNLYFTKVSTKEINDFCKSHPKLRWLDISGLGLKEIPKAIYTLEKLETLIIRMKKSNSNYKREIEKLKKYLPNCQLL